MKTCTNCQKQLEDGAELCSCGKWFRIASNNTKSSSSNVQRETPRWLMLVAAIPILLLAKCVGAIVADSLHGSRAGDGVSIPASLTKIANEVNKGLPLTIDKFTRMDTVVPGPGNRFSYYYTLTQLTATTVDRSELEKNRATLAKAACNRTSVRNLLSEGTTVVYVYKGSDGSDITSVKITPESCAAP